MREIGGAGGVAGLEALRCPGAQHREIAMSTAAKLLAQKQRLLKQLESDPGPNERAAIERLLEKIETALSLLDQRDAARPGDE